MTGSTTDHMLTVTWSNSTGWGAPAIVPYAPLPLDPSATVLHYANECFEGMKAYRSKRTGKIRVFRPDLNAKRLNMSADRIALPSFDNDEFVALLCAFAAVEERWLAWSGNATMSDTDENDFLYLRPMMIGTTPRLGLSKPNDAMLLIIASKLPSWHSRPLRLLASSPEESVRAWPGGFGYAKVGANYGPTLKTQSHASSLGYDQVLWLFDADKRLVTEAGGANFFVVWRTEDGRVEFVTAPLEFGTVLDGVTRRSVMELVRERMPEISVSERHFSVDEIVAAVDSGRIIEAFACGTAFFIAPVGEIGISGRDVKIPLKVEGKSGEYARTARRWLEEIMYGEIEHAWGVEVN
ncbi:aminotransferase [Lipomyces tetrasporus]|uniref:Branched-chain-amino-acid aminotransferase n=1 Tax=Lipomyces tetrasporus TaxID=54092 RepID=A0AAD7VSE7_9ASCO|nr:aminotransferase [Lipomyces tetrasporus]KAJ8099025.1 aminotransferase [Lipomyces tetrasporus]